jgi:hypothetical protein
MAKLQRNFIKGKMNKSLDERLVPNGEYIDALNVRVGSTELSEVGVIENSKGNIRLTTLDLVAKDRITLQLTSYPLSSDAKCIGAYEDSANETIYWFITDPSHTGPQVTGKLDLIVSFDVNDNSVTYHVVSVDDGGGVNTSLNFNSDYLITGVDKVDDLLFFTDDLNQPRMIDVTRDYPAPGYVGGLPTEPYLDSLGSPTFFAESLLVIKKPPVNSPTFQLTNRGLSQNFLEDRFICFAYRYRYENDMYSATSQFTNPAFIPKAFNYDPSSYLNEGMVNSFDTALITINSGSKLVVGIDLLFKEASNPVIRVIEKLDKEELGIGDNEDYTYQFSNNKIYTILDDNEILRLYDNVPLKAKAQTIMGSRLVYGNYLEGYDVDETQLRYELEYVSSDIGFLILGASLTSSQYDLLSSGLSPSKNDSAFVIDFSNVLSSSGPGLKEGSRIDISITFEHGSFELIGLANPITQTAAQSFNFSYVLNQDFNTVQDLFSSQDFKEKIGVNSTVETIGNSCTGVTFTDGINCSIPISKVDSNLDVYTKEGSGISQPIPVQGVLDPNVYTGSVPSPTFNSNEIAIQLPASVYVKNGTIASKVAEYYRILNVSATFQSVSETSSLHSDRDYEVGIIYMDEFNRSTTVLVSPTNIVHIPCSSSDKINTLKVTIPTSQLPPTWAKRYKLAIKQDKEIYETIYSDFYFEDPTSGYSYVLLEGENAQKVESGDVLKIKRDASGVLDTCVTVTVLEKEAKERDFVDPPLTTLNGNDFYIPSGVYMKLKVSSFSLNTIFQFTNRRFTFEVVELDYPYNFPRVLVPVNFTGPDSNPVFFDESLSFGDTIRLEFTFDRPGEDGVLYTCTRRKYEFDQIYTVSQNYNSFKNWWEGDNIPLTLGNGQQTIGPFQTQVNLFVDPTLPSYYFFPYIDILANAPDDVPQGNIRMSYFRFYEDLGKKYLIVQSGSQVCRPNGKSEIEVKITITKGANVFIFETQSQDAAPDIWYESPVSYPITGGFHEGNVQNQTALLPAIINTEFENCFAFGNGAESYKIKDSITRSSFGLGNRTSSVLKGEEFKQVRRFADLTYSGIYNYNINNFNEFNLGLLNFKALEPSFGLIQKIFARQTDILVLQEDKISYVLAGKNLLSDSAAGGVVTSAPDVLGTQIARMEEYGIGNNAESFAVYGYDKYFTDSKRGVVIQLKGSAYSNEQLIVISDFGMSSWFRDLFLDYPNTQKLGGYDPYAKEYVLVSNQTLLPMEEEIIDGGTKKTVTADEETPVSQTINLGPYVGDAILTYSVKDITNEFLLRVEYDSVNYDTSLTSTTLGTVTIPKTSVNPQTAILSVTSVTALSDSSIELDVQLNKPEAPILKIIQVCVSDSNEGLETIHNEYQWTSGTFISPLHSEFVSLKEGTDSPLVSQYNEIIGQQGGGIAPINGATVEIISKKYQSDNFVFDNTVNSFGYLRSSTLYSNTPTDIANLIAASTSVPPVGSGSVFSGSFTMPTSTDEYLYLIYDYRKPVAITLCYSNTSADDACCTCGVSATYYINAPILQEATAVYTSAALTTKAADGWYSYEGVYRKQTSGVLETSILCSACNLSCGTTLLMSTGRGYYTINADLGASTGAVVIDIDFKTLPDGVKVVYDGVTYNAVYSPNFGYLSSTGTEPLYGGITAFDCGISGTTYPALNKFQFNGNGFNATGELESVTVDPASVQLQASGLGTCKIIIPKTAASPSTAEITIISPCESAEIDIDVFCPAALPSFLLTRTGPEPTNVSGLCSASVDATFYHVVVNGTAGNPAVGDIMYQDANGSAVALAGFYAVVTYPTSAAVIEVDANGIIINSILACVP